jgi:LSD1 subclass zinc finger protein
MSIAVVCSKCSAKLNAPDGAAGKKVKCPKCQAPIVVPAALPAEFEVVDEAPKPAKKSPSAPAKAKRPLEDDDDDRPRKRKRRDDRDDEEEDYEDRPRKKRRRDDDDEDDDDDRPRKKKRRRRDDEGGVTTTRNIVMAVVLILLIAVAAFIFYERSKEKDEKTSSNSNANSTNAKNGVPPLTKGETNPVVGEKGGESGKQSAWTPDPSLVKELTQKGEVARYQILLPPRFFLIPNNAAPPTGLEIAGWSSKSPEGLSTAIVSIMVSSSGSSISDAKKDMRQALVNTSAGYTDGMQIKISTRGPTEEGLVNGIEFSRFKFTAEAPNQTTAQGLVYGAIDSGRLVVVIGMGFGDLANSERQLLESVVATLKKV